MVTGSFFPCLSIPEAVNELLNQIYLPACMLLELKLCFIDTVFVQVEPVPCKGFIVMTTFSLVEQPFNANVYS